MPNPGLYRNPLALLATLLLGACDRTGGAAPRGAESAFFGVSNAAPTGVQLQAVATLNAGAPNTVFALVSGACVQQSCRAHVALVANGQQLDAVPLAFAASDAKLTANPNDASFSTNAALTSYTAGEEEGIVTTLIQLVRLAAARPALLVQQAGGFEHVKRRRDLFIVEDRKLKNVWSTQDGQGPVRSYADVVGRNASTDEIVLIEGIAFAPSEFDQVTALRLQWDEQAGTMQALPVERMWAVVTGSFATAEAARLKLVDVCLGNYWVIKGNQVGERAKRFVLARLIPDTSAVELHVDGDGECSSRPTGRMAQFRFTHENNR